MALSINSSYDVSRETLNRLNLYCELLLEWNSRINLIGRSTESESAVRHFEDSLQLLSHLPEDGVLVDFGSGAGFPGLVLAMARPRLQVHLIESDKRKAVFLSEAARITDTPIRLHAQRIEAVQAFSADIITARACAPLHVLLEWSSCFLGTRTLCLFPKGKNYITEVEAVSGWQFDLDVIPSRVDNSSVLLKLQHLQRIP